MSVNTLIPVACSNLGSCMLNKRCDEPKRTTSLVDPLGTLPLRTTHKALSSLKPVI